ncbi:MAG: hypothetical protein WBX15_02040, partial [Thermoanaerobaculia bacterium]
MSEAPALPAKFDDFLRLDDLPFERERLIVFSGESGSGKSTAIAHLLREHPRFAGREHVWVEGPPFGSGPRASLIAIDEIVDVRDLPLVTRCLWR